MVIETLPVSNTLESNRKTVYQIYLTVAAQGLRHLTPTQFDTISSIAHQCPLEGGSAVFLARALYQYNERKHFDDSWLCEGGQQRDEITRVVSSSSGGIKLAPNPATGVVNVVFEGLTKDQQADIQVISVSGQLVLARLGINDEVVGLDVSHFPDGLYFCIINISAHPQQTAKLSIQH